MRATDKQQAARPTGRPAGGVAKSGKRRTPFPDCRSAPASVHEIAGNCGLLVAWGVLTHFGRRTSTRSLVASCRHTKAHGVFTIALALALHDEGLGVTFHSDRDPSPKRLERACYRRALAAGLPRKGGIDIATLLRAVGGNKVVIVFYDTDEGNGHFSPLLGRRANDLILPYSDEGAMDLRKFARCWRAPGIHRQCLVVEETSSGA